MIFTALPPSVQHMRVDLRNASSLYPRKLPRSGERTQKKHLYSSWLLGADVLLKGLRMPTEAINSIKNNKDDTFLKATHGGVRQAGSPEDTEVK